MFAYTKHPDISGILGYIVNVHDPVNYDIDLFLSPQLRKKYSQVITNTYTYQDEGDTIRTGITYRCRLKGVGVVTSKQRKMKTSPSKIPNPEKDGNLFKSLPRHPGKKKDPVNFIIREAHIAIIRQFDRQNGWVICTISDVDIYRRLLVTLYDPITRKDLSEILLSEEYKDYFRPYNHLKQLDRTKDPAEKSETRNIETE